MTLAKVAALVALPLLMAASAGQAYAYDNDDQALRLRDIVADPSRAAGLGPPPPRRL